MVQHHKTRDGLDAEVDEMYREFSPKPRKIHPLHPRHPRISEFYDMLRKGTGTLMRYLRDYYEGLIEAI